jgi:regulator of replication initiation timing
LQTVKSHGAERDELERLRQEAASSGNAERIVALEKETQQLRAAVAQASNLVNTWKAERERLMEENERLHEEVYYLRSVAMNPAQTQDSTRAYAQQAAYPAYEQSARPVRADVITAESRFAQQSAPTAQAGPTTQQKEFSQVADKLATMFAEAYQLISQFKTNLDTQQEPQQQQRQSQPTMQVLRPDVVNAEAFYPRR